MRKSVFTFVLFALLLQYSFSQNPEISNNPSLNNHSIDTLKRNLKDEPTVSSRNKVINKFSKTDHVNSYKGTFISGQIVVINYEFLEGVNPNEFGYFFAIWQGDEIMGLTRALCIQDIANTNQDGSFNLSDLGLEDELDYTIGLGVNNKDSTSISTTLFIPKDAVYLQEFSSKPSTIKLINQGTNSLVASFTTPLFNLPNKNKNWIALFEGEFTTAFYKGINNVCFSWVQETTNEGDESMNDIPGGLIIGQTYTLVYGMSANSDIVPDYKTIVATTQFEVPFRN